MTTLQSIAIFLSLVALAFAPMALAAARRRDSEPQPASPAPADPTTVEGVLSARDAVAHHLYGEAVGWDPVAMADYDDSALLQATWKAEADRKLDKSIRINF